MSERMLEEVREHNRMVARVRAIEGYLDNTDRRTFTVYEVQKIVMYIKSGGEGWI